MIGRRRAPLGTLLAAALAFRIGNAVAQVALPWLVLSRTGSARWAGVTAASGVIATIVGAVFGGSVVDRWSPRAVAAFAGVFGGLAIALIPLLDAADALPLSVMVALVALGAFFDAPGLAAQDSRLPELGRLAGVSLERVSALKAVLGSSAYLGGPVAGGAAVGLLGAAPTLWIVAGCSTLSGLLSLAALPGRRRRRRAASERGFRWAGLAHLWREPLLAPLLGVIMLFAGTTSTVATVILPALFQREGRAATELGAFSSALGAGALLGVVVYGAIGRRIQPRVWLPLAFLAYAGAVLLLSLLPPLPALVALGTVVGFATGPTSPIFNTALYQRTPPELRGRVLGATSAAILSGAPVMTVAGGLLVDRSGSPFALLVAASLAMLAAGFSLRLRFDSEPVRRLATATVPPAPGEKSL